MAIDTQMINYFGSRLIRRYVKSDISNSIGEKNLYILTGIGLPCDVLDFEFKDEIKLDSNKDTIIGKTSNGEDVLMIKNSGKIIRSNDGCFFANSLENYFKQLYAYDYLWQILIKESHLGKYRENKNHAKYASHIKAQLLEIDPELLLSDLNYFWGALIEDIEFGIVG
jgi:hypothetical protein